MKITWWDNHGGGGELNWQGSDEAAQEIIDFITENQWFTASVNVEEEEDVEIRQQYAPAPGQIVQANVNQLIHGSSLQRKHSRGGRNAMLLQSWPGGRSRLPIP